jgi:hypothetical protein
MDYADAFSMGEDFSAVSIQTYGLKTGTDVSGLLAYLGYQVEENGRLKPAKELLGTLPEGIDYGS